MHAQTLVIDMCTGHCERPNVYVSSEYYSYFKLFSRHVIFSGR